MALAMAGKLGIGLLLAVNVPMTSASWSLVAPRTESLPTGEPPSSFERRENNIDPVGVSSELDARPALLHTNKFYSNFLIEGPDRSAWTLPYIVTVNNEHPFGMYVSYPKAFDGERDESDNRLKWYATTTTKDVILSAEELYTNQEASFVDFDDEGLSATVEFSSEDVENGSMTAYLTRGMAYATVLYEDFTPEISSIHAILTVNGEGASNGGHHGEDGRFVVELNDGSTWILYSSEKDLELYFLPTQPNEPNKLKANITMNGTLRATRVPYEDDNPLFEESMGMLDEYAGSYPVSGKLKAHMHTTREERGKYKIVWDTAGDGSGLLHYALPHQQALLNSSVKTDLFCGSPTKGDMELVMGTTWIFIEYDLPQFEWVPGMSTITNDLEMSWIEYYLEREIAVPPLPNDVAGGSIYFGAKNLMAYAQLCLVATEIGRDDLVTFCVDETEGAFDYYLQHENGNPLVYDTTWGGVIGALGLEEEGGGADFYASYYNDHHFHYSYVINIAAVLAHLRPSWATAENKDWVETLIRDVNNPNEDDEYFPQFRSFDWYCGHSWARGLLFAYDGKDQESTSEDVNFFYAMTMWAIATGNSYLEGLGRLQTGVLTRSIKEYFLIKDGNTNHPPDFARNKVTGIFFESKVDYTTWFGNKVEYIHGIQNIPVTAITGSVRDPQFVREEWDQRLSRIADGVQDVWRTVLYMSYATVQKHRAFEKMMTSGVEHGLLRSWALYWAATRPECDTYCNHDEVVLDEIPVPTPAPVAPEGAYRGIPQEIPGLIEVEYFDYGGEGVGYSDTDFGNIGGAFRSDEAVDIGGAADGYYVGWIRAGEFLKFTVDVTTDVHALEFSFRISTPTENDGSFRIVTGGTDCDDYTTDLSGHVFVPSTGGWNNFASLTTSGGGNGGLVAGVSAIWLCIISEGFNIESFVVAEQGDLDIPTPSPTQAPSSTQDEETPAPFARDKTPAPVAPGGGAYGGVPAAIPGKIEAEEFDTGGEGIGYSDVDPGNNGGAFRLDEGVDVGSAAGELYVGWVMGGEYLRYTVDVTVDVDAFDFNFLVASPTDGSGSFRIVTGGTGCEDYATNLSGLVMVPSTGGWGTFGSVTVSDGGNGGLLAGPATIWLCATSQGFNIGYFGMFPHQEPARPTPSPLITRYETPVPVALGGAYGGIPAVVPGLIEAEEFDTGGEGVGYSDTDPGNNGGAFRTDQAVDVSERTDGSGYSVGWTRAGEYLRYTVEVEETAETFYFSFQVAAPPGNSGSMRVIAGGTGCDDYTTDLSGLVTVPSTGGWEEFEPLLVIPGGGTGGLPAGPAIIRLCFISAGFNIDSFTMTDFL